MVNVAMFADIFWPNGGMWEPVIHAFFNGIGSYAWTIIIVTIVLRLILSPLDFWQRLVTKRNATMQAKLKPEIEKLQKAYGANKQMLNQKQMELYKRHGFSPIGGCAVMGLNLIATMAIFFTLYGSLTNVANYNLKEQYPQLQAAYYQSYIDPTNPAIGGIAEYFDGLGIDTSAIDFTKITAADNYNLANALNTGIANGSITQDDLDAAKNAVLTEYNRFNASFLWVKSIWRSDTIVGTIPGFSEYTGIAGLKFNDITLQSGTYVTLMGTQSVQSLIEGGYVDEIYTNSGVGYIKVLGSTTADFPNDADYYFVYAADDLTALSGWIDDYNADPANAAQLITYTSAAEGDAPLGTVVAAADQKQAASDQYDAIMGGLIKQEGSNGIYMLIVLAVLVTLGSQLLLRWSNKPKGGKKDEKAPAPAIKMPGTGMAMMVIMPAIMLLFTLMSTAAFALYIIASQLIVLLTIPFSTLIIRRIEANKEAKANANGGMDYRRKDAIEVQEVKPAEKKKKPENDDANKAKLDYRRK